MSKEIYTPTLYPYSAIVHLAVTFPDGSQALGSGVVVGRNDILTATHVLYDPDRGGLAVELSVAAGVDYDSRTGRYESAPLVELDGVRWESLLWPEQTFAIGSNLTMYESESQYDVALIGLSQALGEQTGWFDLAPGHDSPQWATQIGYPSGSSGMMEGQAWVERDNDYAVYNAESTSGSDIMGPGSSGGPLFVYVDGQPQVIGVKSSGSDTSSTWADVGLLYGQLLDFMTSNDQLLGDAPLRPPVEEPVDPWTPVDVDWKTRPLNEFMAILGTKRADVLRGDFRDELLQGLSGKDWLSGGIGSDRLEGGVGNDSLRGGSGNDILMGGAGRDRYEWGLGELQVGGEDLLVDGRGSRLVFDDALLAQLQVAGTALDALAGKVALAARIDAGNSIAWSGGDLQVDLDGNGVFEAHRDFAIEIVGTFRAVQFDGRDDTLVLV